MEECLDAIGKSLVKNDYVFVDGFIDEEDVASLKEDVKKVYDAGKLRLGVLAGGKAGKSLTYTHKKVRGDVVEWYDGTEEFWKKNGSLQDHLQKCDTFVSELSEHISGLDGILNRSKAMVTCYPGNGARYIKHTDNNCKFGDGDSCNGRRLTALTYLNDSWQRGDGGELRVYGRDGEEIKAEVAPVAGRILLFWSDFRVPHEVLPTHKERFAITLWYFDKVERARALSSGVTDTEEGKMADNVHKGDQSSSADGAVDPEYERIRKEVEKMEQEYGPGATLNVNISKDGDDLEGGAGDVKDDAAVETSTTKRENSGISFVRIGIDSGEEEENEIVQDSANKQMKTETNEEKSKPIPAADDAAEQPVATGSAYEMLEKEDDVWELDD